MMKKWKEKKVLKTFFTSTAAVCLCSALLVGANSAILAMAMGETEEIPTTYNQIPSAPKAALDNYVKADYKIVELENPMSKTAKGQASFINAVSMEDAVETGAQYIWETYGADLNGKTIQAFYFIDPERLRAYWAGDVFESEEAILDYEKQFSFTIDAITGEAKSVGISYDTLDKGETTPFHPEKTKAQWKDNCEEYLDLAAEYGERHLNAKVVSSVFKDVSAVSFAGEESDLRVRVRDDSRSTYTTDATTTVSDGTDQSIENVTVDYTTEASCIMIVALVTDEYGRQCEVEIATGTKEIVGINTVVPNDPNGAVGVG